MKLFNGIIDTMEKSLDFSMAKSRTISHNIANVDTPNYKAKDIVFKNVLHDKIINSGKAKQTHLKHLPFSSQSSQPYQVISQRNTMYNHNRNNVDIDKEMTELAKNQIYYQSIIDRLNGEFSNIQTVIRGGS